MERYKNLNGDSGAVCYEFGPDYIWVVFLDGTRYLYTYGAARRPWRPSRRVLR